MKSIVVSQPMLFPWIGMFEQINLSNNYVHYDDVQLPIGRSFMNRVQIKTKDGYSWLTIPIKKETRKGLIMDAEIAYYDDWRGKHLKFLENNYAKAQHRDMMLSIVNDIYGHKYDRLSCLNIASIEKISDVLGISTNFSSSSDLGFKSSGSQKLFDIVTHLEGNKYISGLGALNYLDYEIFEKSHISVEYMDYRKKEYPQLHGEFNPYVSVLDAIANTGNKTEELLVSKSTYWKEFVKH